MAAMALLTTACAHETTTEKEPVRKPEITLTGDRLTPEALWAMGRIGDVVPDPETGGVLYTVSYYSVPENRSTTWVRVAYEEGERLQTTHEWVGNSPMWWGNGQVVYLKQGKLYLTAGMSNAKELCLEGFDKDIEGFLLSPMRDKIILIAQVKTVPTTADKYADLPLATGRVVDDLMYKHWDEWTQTAPHPFVGDLVNDGKRLAVSNIRDLLEGTPFECPMKPFGGVEQLAWSPDEKQIAYTCRKKTGIDYAVSTNSDIYLYDLATGACENLTAPNGGYDINPSYSPDGHNLAWLSMERDGYESDENRLMVKDLQTGQVRFVSKGLDTNVDTYYWKDDSTLVFSAVWQATQRLYRTDLLGNMQCLTSGQYDYVPCGSIADTYYCKRHSMQEADEIYRFAEGQNVVQLTTENKNIYDQIDRGTIVPRWQRTTDGKNMLTWVIYPPHFNPLKQYPTLLYCEGGPQSPVSQFWSYRWNFMMMAANDYIIVAPNRRGLPGFGKEWNEAISGDYGGQCMRDYLTAIDEFVQNEPYVDKQHLGCVGASFGGFSVYWLAGHHDKRFKAFIAHDGIFNMEMQYLETEEKWFANWDMGGAYWDKDNKIAQRTFANSPHKFVDKWDTPILCIHGEKDYRILANQGMAAFDAAKMRGIPAELLIFPDENHWVLQPQNGILWQRTFFAWLDRWLKSSQQ